jgi:hypothetical protein
MRGIWLYFQNLGAEPRPGAVPSAAAGG